MISTKNRWIVERYQKIPFSDLDYSRLKHLLFYKNDIENNNFDFQSNKNIDCKYKTEVQNRRMYTRKCLQK